MGIAAIVALVFLLNRRFADLAIFMVAVVSWVGSCWRRRGLGDGARSLAHADGVGHAERNGDGRAHDRSLVSARVPGRPADLSRRPVGAAVPGGVPLRGVGYFALALGLMVLLGRVPGAGEAVGVLSAPLRYVIVPLAIAVLASQAAPDGRVAHRFAADWLGCGWRPAPLRGPPCPRRRCAGRVRRCARRRCGTSALLACIARACAGPRGSRSMRRWRSSTALAAGSSPAAGVTARPVTRSCWAAGRSWRCGDDAAVALRASEPAGRAG